jgi:glycosyltransferase involved in cell wall biosynthesis
MIYRKKADVVYPPFDFDYWLKIEKKIKRNSQLSGKFNYLLKKPYFLVVSRLEPYKKIDIVIDTFKKYNFSHYFLVIVGEGSQAFRLKIKAGKNILFFSRITDEELGWLYQNAQALVMPQEEDFGYVSLEAQFFGCPVIAFGQGGATETILDGRTGIFLKSQTKGGLSEALERFHTISYNLKKQVEIFGKENVKKFNKEKFKSYFLKYLKI